MGIQLLQVIWLTTLPTSSFVYSFFRTTVEELINWEERMEALEELKRQIQNPMDSQAHQDFQIQDPYSIFQVSP